MSNKGGIGVGSASIVLVFAVLSLTVFSLITYVVASNDKALVVAEAQLVTGFYEADALSERIVAEVLVSRPIPASVQGVSIEHDYDTYLDAEVVEFSCPISDNKALYVKLAVRDTSHEVLSWRMYDTDEWDFNDRLNVWTGPDGGIDFGMSSDVWLDLWMEDE